MEYRNLLTLDQRIRDWYPAAVWQTPAGYGQGMAQTVMTLEKEHFMQLELSVVPLGIGTSVGEYVADIHRRLKTETSIRVELGPMGTVIEGDPHILFRLARELHEMPFSNGAGRVYTVIKIDDRRDKPSTLESKVESVKKRL